MAHCSQYAMKPVQHGGRKLPIEPFNFRIECCSQLSDVVHRDCIGLIARPSQRSNALTHSVPRQHVSEEIVTELRLGWTIRRSPMLRIVSDRDSCWDPGNQEHGGPA